MGDIKLKKSNEVHEVLMLEAEPFFDPKKDSMQLKWPYESPRGAARNS